MSTPTLPPTESSEIIQTATVVIFSSDMRNIIVVINKKLNSILPPGGKFDPEKDNNILDTALREVLEEIGLVLSPKIGNFLDKNWVEIIIPEPVLVESFQFINGSGSAQDSLFFFRLHASLNFTLKNEMQWFFVNREFLLKERMTLGIDDYQMLLSNEQSGMRKMILNIVRG